MHFSILSALAALPILASASAISLPLSSRDSLGQAIVQNKCPYPLYVWSVDQYSSGHSIKIPSGQQYRENLRIPCANCGVSLKVSKNPNSDADPITQFEYSVHGGLAWYDISLVNCARNGKDASPCPGWERGLSAKGNLASNYGGCGLLKCPKGQQCPQQAYYVAAPNPQPVRACGQNGQVVFVACSG